MSPPTESETHPGAPPAWTVERFSELVGRIYECALTPGLWPAALTEACTGVGAQAGWIAMHQPRLVRSSYPVEVGTDPAWQKRLAEEFVGLSPFMGIVHHVRVGEVWSVADVIDYDQFREGRFYREWSEPQGIDDTIMGVLTKTPDAFTWLGVCLPMRATATHKTLVRQLLPHIERTLRISEILEFRAAQSADLLAAVSTLPTGIVLVDSALAVRGANPAAERLMAETGALSVRNGRLVAARGEAGERLSEALAACAGSRLDAAGVSVLFPGAEGRTDLMVQLAPLPRPHANPGGEAVAALFLSAPSEPNVAPTEAFVRRYGLTPSETRVLLAMLDGQTPRGIAEATGVSLPTIRTHLSHLYAKTDTARQADLVGLFARSVG
ncbi:MAG: helix-turn-helix transcriptional regulator [Phenylobacterium sp.]|uniref:helix-turn-helix transcriptional regulator n=1 Tax=Phenylobacterium sp. TaxID=1871053 RepID=UPI001A4D3FC1|nr:helix-turn-helix transcriptional regulator [Phenylobacterium sp.]MBL8556733.1 helix-turn-helix transcriptional regulator [Phenylobacterium sp.]